MVLPFVRNSNVRDYRLASRSPIPRAIREYRYFRAEELERERLKVCEEIHDS